MSTKRRSSGKGRRLLLLLAALTAIGAMLLLFVVVEGMPGPRHGAYLAYAQLVNVSNSLRAYSIENGHLPPATAMDPASGELCSWRIDVSPLLLQPLARTGKVRFDYDRQRPWNDPVNLRLQELGASFFEYAPREKRTSDREYATYYQAVTGPGTAFDGATPPVPDHLPPDVILIVRVERSETHWMQPGDLNIHELLRGEDGQRLLRGENGYAVLFADGEVWIFSNQLPFSDLCKFFTVAGAKKADRDQVLRQYRVL